MCSSTKSAKANQPLTADSIADAVLREIEASEKEFLLVAIDGRCGSGKTTLARKLQSLCDCNVIHMDHFYPRMIQRTAARLSEPGGNLDRERFIEEIMLPLKRRDAFEYRPYIPWQQRMGEPIRIIPRRVNILEGSYSCHPALYDSYDLRVFLTVDETEQIRRIRQRNGEDGLVQFQEKWIPMEERYFSAFDIQKRCDMCFDTSVVI